VNVDANESEREEMSAGLVVMLFFLGEAFFFGDASLFNGERGFFGEARLVTVRVARGNSIASELNETS
jgi:hypothetical protein